MFAHAQLLPALRVAVHVVEAPDGHAIDTLLPAPARAAQHARATQHSTEHVARVLELVIHHECVKGKDERHQLPTTQHCLSGRAEQQRHQRSPPQPKYGSPSRKMEDLVPEILHEIAPEIINRTVKTHLSGRISGFRSRRAETNFDKTEC